MEGDSEAEHLECMSEETYCAVNSTSVTKLSSDHNYHLPVSSYTNTELLARNNTHLHNFSSQIVKQVKTLTPKILRVAPAYTLMPAKESSRSGEVNTASNLNLKLNVYLAITQRVVRKSCSGVNQLIRVSISRDFVKNQDAVVVCPQCDHLYADLQSLDDHMISLHDVDVDQTCVNDTEGSTPNVIIIAPRVANSDQASQFSCSVCNQVLNSTTQEWQRHVYMHLRSRAKRGEDNEASELPRAAEVIVVDEVEKTTDNKLLLASGSESTTDLPANIQSFASYQQPIKSKRGRKILPQNINKDGDYQNRYCLCKLCKKFTYSKQGELRHHVLNQHGDELRKCQHCDMAFPLGSDLLRHIRRYHAGLPVEKNPPAGMKARTPTIRICLTENSIDVIKVETNESENEDKQTLAGVEEQRLANDLENEIDLNAEGDAGNDDNTHDVMQQDDDARTTNRLDQHNSSTLEKKTLNHKPLVNSKSEEKACNKRKGSAKMYLIVNGNNDSFSVESCNGNDNPNGNVAGSNTSKYSKRESLWVSAGNGSDQQAVQKTKHGIYKGFQPTTCDHCGVWYEKRRELVAHINSEHADKLLQCPSCPKKFALADSIKTHNKSHHVKEMYTCRRCDMKFLTLGRLRRHIRIEHLGKPVAASKKMHYNCTFCGKIFHSKQVLDGHINQHHLNVRPYKCSICGTDFCYVNNLKAHERICTNSMMCELCGENFSTKARLAEHQKSAHDVVLDALVDTPQLYCDHCNKNYPDEFSLKCHLLRVNAAAAKPSVLCDICGKECKKASGLTIHKAYCHPHEVAEREVSAVPVGGASNDVAATSDASAYIKTRADSLANSFSVAATPVTCSDCGKKFQSSLALRSHQVRKHLSNGSNKRTRFSQHTEVMMTCPSCGLECRGKVGLSAHLRIKHAETQLTDVTCDKCDRTFDNKFGELLLLFLTDLYFST
jgi:uncharacterized C2H2 Zn-finger protein